MKFLNLLKNNILIKKIIIEKDIYITGKLISGSDSFGKVLY